MKYITPMLFKIAIMLVFFTASNKSFAQDNHFVSKPDAEVDTAHDKPENDPSQGNELTLPKEIEQRRYLITKTLSQITKNLTHSSHQKVSKTAYQNILFNQPTLFDLFKIHQHRYIPELAYGPATVNADHEYKGISDRSMGFCWGYSTMVRYFTVLAFFDESVKNPAPLSALEYQEWIKFYQKKIDQVLRGEATLIPGFRSFRELSLVPELEFYLKLNAMELWRSRAVKLTSIDVLHHSLDQMTPAKVDALLINLEKRLKRGEIPKILFSALIPSEKILGMNGDIHSVLVYKVERLPNHAAKIYLWDINFYTETLKREPKFLEITPERGILYAPWYEPTKPYAKASDLVANVRLSPENDQETAQMLLSLKKFCSNRNNFSRCEKND